MSDERSGGVRWAQGIATGDREVLLALLAPEVDFRAMTPMRFWEASAPSDVLDAVLGTWFGGDRHIEAVELVDTDVMADRERVGYRFRATTPEGPSLVEQQAYLGVDDGRISWLRIMCTGFRPLG